MMNKNLKIEETNFWSASLDGSANINRRNWLEHVEK
jgi:hypothetical protein